MKTTFVVFQPSKEKFKTEDQNFGAKSISDSMPSRKTKKTTQPKESSNTKNVRRRKNTTESRTISQMLQTSVPNSQAVPSYVSNTEASQSNSSEPLTLKEPSQLDYNKQNGEGYFPTFERNGCELSNTLSTLNDWNFLDPQALTKEIRVS